jgi:hypothetical protein
MKAPRFVTASLFMMLIPTAATCEQLKAQSVDGEKKSMTLGELTFLEYHCSDTNRCGAHCETRDDILISGGCVVQETQDGKLPPALQDAFTTKEEHGGRHVFTCHYQSAAKTLLAQALCLSSPKKE